MSGWRMPAVTVGWERVLDAGGLHHDRFAHFGPCGFTVRVRTRELEPGSLIVTEADYDDDVGTAWLHVSAAFETRVPSYPETVLLHRALFGRRRYAYQIFAPENAHVNLHPNALHLWGRCDGLPALPGIAELVARVGSV